ncbi:MAG: HNH endonuclease, partial [Pseudomonadota bacterium]
MLGSNVLVLNRSYLPVQITTIKRAMILLFKGVARALDKELQTYDFKSWAELSAAVHDDTIGLVDKLIRVPRVIVLTQYNRLPKRSVCFSRYNILLRDDFTCQYCSKRLSKGSLNLDHVVPRSRGGKT